MSVESGDIEALQDRRDFSDSYLKFCELTLMGEDTAATIRDLLADWPNSKHCERKQYENGGRHELTVFMQKNAKAARKAGFEEGMASTEECQQIYDELEKIDRGLAKIGETLKESKQFWEGVDRKLSPTSAGQQTKDPPDGITGPEELRIERHAENIHAGLQTVHQAAQDCSKSKKIRKAGDKIVGNAATLIKNCTDVVQTQSSAEIHLHNPKLSLRFTKYAEMIYLLVWFAGSTATDKLLMDKPEYVQVAQAELISKGLFTASFSSYALPFEIVLTSVNRQLHEMRKLWTEVVVPNVGPSHGIRAAPHDSSGSACRESDPQRKDLKQKMRDEAPVCRAAVLAAQPATAQEPQVTTPVKYAATQTAYLSIPPTTRPTSATLFPSLSRARTY
ncbi:hypothetical protein B0H13DRAFT_2348814 [Mycena leptocephala]|nr:hypothetical protein B0H13DRAFT_2348814 [Mycena leptocephala]